MEKVLESPRGIVPLLLTHPPVWRGCVRVRLSELEGPGRKAVLQGSRGFPGSLSDIPVVRVPSGIDKEEREQICRGRCHMSLKTKTKPVYSFRPLNLFKPKTSRTL